jgi:DNA/RNA-binding domain of Phe-tRNA-synthetase-like protein
MLDLSIDPQLKAVVPRVAVAAVTANVQVRKHDPALWAEIQGMVGRCAGLTMEAVRRFPPINALREAYKALGNDPTRYRGSNEALFRRIVHDKGLYQVNTVVDINNLVTLETLHSAGVFDLDRVELPMVFRAGRPGESYAGIGRGEMKIAGLPVFADRRGPFGSTTSDSERTMVQLQTTRILLVVISFIGSGQLAAALNRAVGLLTRYASAAASETGVAV